MEIGHANEIFVGENNTSDSQQTLVIDELSSNEGIPLYSPGSDLKLIHYLTASKTEVHTSILEVLKSMEFVSKKLKGV